MKEQIIEQIELQIEESIKEPIKEILTPDVKVDQTTLDIFLYFNYLQVN